MPPEETKPHSETEHGEETPETGFEEDRKKEEDKDEQSSPRGILDIPISGSESDNSSNISSSSSSSFNSSLNEKSPDQQDLSKESYGLLRKGLFGRIKRKSVRRFSVIPLLSACEHSTKNLRKKLGFNRCALEEIDGGEIVVPFPKPSWRNFNQEELVAATCNFSPDNLIGKGGHAEVYRGHLPDGQIVAVKRITKEEHRVGEFLSELGIIAHTNHPNAAKLIGFGVDGGLHLVLQFSPHGSLASALHGSKQNLEWKVRLKVAIGVAEGLQYLHCECQRRIIHRDITASNILLTEDYEPQISDFGLAKWLPEKWVHHVVFPIEGTFGYMAPEYFMHGIVDEKTDVFAFGVLLLELITGRRAVDSCRQSLVMWAKPLLEDNNVKELVDPRLGDNYDTVEMKRAMFTASNCVDHLPNLRPNMTRVLQLLRGETVAVAVAEMKQKSKGGRAVMLGGCDLEDYSSTTYIKDLNRHIELVME